MFLNMLSVLLGKFMDTMYHFIIVMTVLLLTACNTVPIEPPMVPGGIPAEDPPVVLPELSAQSYQYDSSVSRISACYLVTLFEFNELVTAGKLKESGGMNLRSRNIFEYMLNHPKMKTPKWNDIMSKHIKIYYGVDRVNRQTLRDDELENCAKFGL